MPRIKTNKQQQKTDKLKLGKSIRVSHNNSMKY